MFRGQFVHSIDTKGRVSLPARFREVLHGEGDARFILTPSPFDSCLHLHPLRAWEEFEQKIDALPRLDRNLVRFRRLYVSAAVECDLDRVGRVLVPPHLRERASLGREVLWAGMGRVIEVWAKERWDAALSMSEDEQRSFQQAITEQFGI